MKLINFSAKILFKLTTYILLLTVNLYKSDLPVHCKREEISGQWTFRINTDVFNPNLNDYRSSCGHGFPDKIEKLNNDINYSFEHYNDISVVLGNDYKVYDSATSQLKGKWTPVYDEGFILNYENSVFTAFMKYYLNPSYKNKTAKPENKDYLSNCSKTMIGWYIRDERENYHNWSCFFAFKKEISHEFLENSNRTFLKPNKFFNNFSLINKENLDEKVNNGFLNGNSLEDELGNDENSFLELKIGNQSGNKMETNLDHDKYEDQAELIKEINSNNLSWQAQIHDDFKGLSFLDLKMKLGLRASKDKLFEKENFMKKGNSIKNNKSPIQDLIRFTQINEQTSNSISKINLNGFIYDTIKNEVHQKEKNNHDLDGEHVTDFNEISKYLTKEINEIDENTLPKNWDWRNIGGESYVPEPRIQGNCGSCYVFSMITSLESRLRIMTNNKDKTVFSRQFPISCNFYTEGCDGGYPILVAKFSNEFELIPEKCFEYKPESSKCSDVCDYSKFQKKYFVSKYEYLGGYYGNTNEVEIMKELRARGPIPGNMSVPWSFSYYKSGIYSKNHLIKNSGKLSKTTLLDHNLSWSSVDHSILLVGYGEENGTKYWIGMNTWGNNWGENGFFRILRGENDCNIESMGDAARISFKLR